MNRRTVLRRAGTVGAFALAGCMANDEAGAGNLDQTQPGNNTRDSGTDTPGTGTPTQTPDQQTPTPEPPFAVPPGVKEATIETLSTDCGSSEDTTASVTRDADSRTITVNGVMITGNPCHEATLKRTAYDHETATLEVDVLAESSLGPDEGACIDCVGAVTYVVRITMDEEMPETVTVRHEGNFVTETAGNASGSDSSGSGSNAPVRIVGKSFEVREQESVEERQSPEIDIDPEAYRVRVTGVIEGKNGCMTATLERASYDAETDVLTVDVETTRRAGTEDQACTMAIVELGYEAEFQFADGVPETVELAHNGQGIASASHATASDSAGTPRASEKDK